MSTISSKVQSISRAARERAISVMGWPRQPQSTRRGNPGGARRLLLQPSLDPGLLVEISLDHVAHNGTGVVPVNSVFEQRDHHDFRGEPRSETYEPGIV